MQLLWCRVEHAAPSELVSVLLERDGRMEEKMRKQWKERGWEWPGGSGISDVGGPSFPGDSVSSEQTAPGLKDLLELGVQQGWDRTEMASAALVLFWIWEAGVQKVFSFPHRITLEHGNAVDLDGLVVRPSGEGTSFADGPSEKAWPAMAGLLRILIRQGKLEYVSEFAPPAFKILEQRKVGERQTVIYFVEKFSANETENGWELPVGTGISHEHEHIDEGMVLLQANIDDMNPEWLPYAMEKLFEHGANDVYAHPIQMKKGRLGTLLNVLCEREKCETLKAVMFSETSTIGVRALATAVHRLGRVVRTLESPWGPVRVKEARAQGKVVQAAPEYEDCRRIAQERGIPLKEVYQWVTATLSMTNRGDGSVNNVNNEIKK